MKFRRLFRQITAMLCAAVLVSGLPAAGAAAKTVNKTVTAAKLQKGLQFTLTGMPYNTQTVGYSPINSIYKGEKFTIRTVQNFAFSPDNRYVFTVSEGYSGDINAGKKHTILCCAELPATPGPDAKAQLRACTILDNFGHGETVAVTASAKANAYDVWVACTPNSDVTARLGTDIMRLTCQIGSEKITVVKKVRLDFSGVKPSRNRLGVAVSSESNQIAFRIQSAQGTCYQIYDLGKLNQQLNSAKNIRFKMAAKKAQQTLLTEISYGSSGSYMPYQSFDIDGKYLYVCGGHLNMGVRISKAKYNIGVKSQRITADTQVISITPQLKIAGKTHSKADLEVEGMKVSPAGGNKVDYYINFFTANTPISNTIGVYKFTK